MPRVPFAWIGATVSALAVLAIESFSARLPFAAQLSAHAVAISFALSSSLVIIAVAGAHRARLRPLPAWLLFVASPAAIVVSQVLGVLRPDASYPSPATYLKVGSLVAMVGFLSLLLRRRSAGLNGAGVIDATIIATAAFLASWVFVIGPQAHAVDVAIGVRSVDIGTTVLDVIVIWICVQMLYDGGARGTSFALMMLSFMVAAVLDGAKFALVLSDAEMAWLIFGRNACYVIVVCAVLHPSSRHLAEGATTRASSSGSRLRIGFLTLAALVSPALTFVEHQHRHRLHGSDDLLVIAVCSAAMVLLVVARMEGMIRSQERTNLALDESLRRLRAADLQQRNTQKLEAVGKLAAGMAHEINTPVQYIGDNLRFLSAGFRAMDVMVRTYHDLVPPALLDDGEEERSVELAYLRSEVPAGIEDALAGVDRVAGIVSALKVFGDPQGATKEFVDVHSAIVTTLAVTEAEVAPVADLVTQLEPVPNVHCSPGDLNQAIFHLVTNAAQAVRDAQRERGEIVISSRVVDDHVEISVRDNGVGIPREIQHRIFDPFFSTREVGQGTGQGLALTWNLVVDRCHGTVHVESEEGEGSIFTLRLPAFLS